MTYRFEEHINMSKRTTRIGLGIGAALIAVGMAAGVLAAKQNTSGNQPPFRGGPMGPLPMGPGGPGRMGPMGLLGPIQRLGLSDEQKNQVKTITESHAEEFKALAERARAAHDALNQAMMADSPDDAAIRQKSAEAAAVDADIAVASAHARAEVFQILTAEQREQLKKWAAGREGRGGPGVAARPPRGGR
jgi:Spy/CpxP family protein refolding chaperone